MINFSVLGDFTGKKKVGGSAKCKDRRPRVDIFQFSSACLTSGKGNGRKGTEWKTRRKRERTTKAKRRKGEANDHTYRIHGAWIHETIILIFTGKIHKGTNGTYTTKQATLVFSLIFAAAHNQDTNDHRPLARLHRYLGEFHFVSVRTNVPRVGNFASDKSGNFDSRFAPSLSN